MKANLCVIACILLTLLIGCKDDKNAVPSNPVVEGTTNSFKVTINAIVRETDKFSLFYTEDGSINFQGTPIWVDVQGDENPQDIVYIIPANVIPTQLRLDFGMNKLQPDIILKSVTVANNERIRSFTGTEIGYYFRPDETKCNYNPVTGIIKAVVKDGARQNPSLYPNEDILQPELEKITL